MQMTGGASRTPIGRAPDGQGARFFAPARKKITTRMDGVKNSYGARTGPDTCKMQILAP